METYPIGGLIESLNLSPELPCEMSSSQEGSKGLTSMGTEIAHAPRIPLF